MVPAERLAQITERFEFLEAKMAEGSGDIAALAREYSELRPVVEQIAEHRRLVAEISEAEAMLSDPEMKELAQDELPRLRARLPQVEEALQLALDSLVDNPDGRIQQFHGTGYPFSKEELVAIMTYASHRIWPGQPVSGPGEALPVEFVTEP